MSGSAAWNGALLGVTSSSETVAGAASLTVNLASLDGRIDFTGMEKWGVKKAPGAVGSGTMWGDGDLEYTIEVSGNTFIQTGGDDGKVTGAFFSAPLTRRWAGYSNAPTWRRASAGSDKGESQNR